MCSPSAWIHARLSFPLAEVSPERVVTEPIGGMSHLIRQCVLLVLSVFLAAAGAHAQIESVRVVGDGETTRVTIWSTGPVEARSFASEAAPGPQIRVDFGLSVNASGPSQPVPAATGVASYRWQDGFLAFDLARPMMVARQLDLPPTGDEARWRIVLDLAAVSDVRFVRAARRDASTVERLRAARETGVQTVDVATAAIADVPTPPARTGAVLTPRERASGRYIVVIDPGHGGKDPGAIAPSTGAQEKDIVLAAALELQSVLERSPRYEVRMTRADDRFIELEDRVTKARSWGADLFISIHADAARSGDVAGASVYTISARGQARIAREAKKNDWNMPIEDGVSDDAAGILEDLLKRETKTNSGVFAELLIPELADAGPILRNTHRNAGFYVLLAPDVPAVLLEMGFLTNGRDARRLADPRGRRASMAAVARAIDSYFDRQDVLLAVN